jgi:hypothetical protein
MAALAQQYIETHAPEIIRQIVPAFSGTEGNNLETRIAELKILVTTETCDLIEKHLPTKVGERIKWGPVIPGELNGSLQCFIECDPKDRCAIIATAEQHFPDKVSEVKEAFRKPTKD